MNQLAYELKQLAKLLKEANVGYAIIGGLAVSLFGEPRLTWDIDASILLENSPESLRSFLKIAKKYGFTPLPPRITTFAKETGVLPMSFSKNRVRGRCDLILAQNAIEYLTIQRAKQRDLFSCKVKVVTPEDLFIHKITSLRPRDNEDARTIFMRQRDRMDMRYISLWLKRIARANRYPQLLHRFNNLKKEAKRH